MPKRTASESPTDRKDTNSLKSTPTKHGGIESSNQTGSNSTPQPSPSDTAQKRNRVPKKVVDYELNLQRAPVGLKTPKAKDQSADRNLLHGNVSGTLIGKGSGSKSPSTALPSTSGTRPAQTSLTSALLKDKDQSSDKSVPNGSRTGILKNGSGSSFALPSALSKKPSATLPSNSSPSSAASPLTIPKKEAPEISRKDKSPAEKPRASTPAVQQLPIAQRREEDLQSQISQMFKTYQAASDELDMLHKAAIEAKKRFKLAAKQGKDKAFETPLSDLIRLDDNAEREVLVARRKFSEKREKLKALMRNAEALNRLRALQFHVLETNARTRRPEHSASWTRSMEDLALKLQSNGCFSNEELSFRQKRMLKKLVSNSSEKQKDIKVVWAELDKEWAQKELPYDDSEEFESSDDEESDAPSVIMKKPTQGNWKDTEPPEEDEVYAMVRRIRAPFLNPFDSTEAFCSRLAETLKEYHSGQDWAKNRFDDYKNAQKEWLDHRKVLDDYATLDDSYQDVVRRVKDGSLKQLPGRTEEFKKGEEALIARIQMKEKRENAIKSIEKIQEYRNWNVHSLMKTGERLIALKRKLRKRALWLADYFQYYTTCWEKKIATVQDWRKLRWRSRRLMLRRIRTRLFGRCDIRRVAFGALRKKYPCCTETHIFGIYC